MAKVVLHPWILEMRGTLGDLVFKKSPQGKMIVAKRPDMSNVKWTPAQKAHRQRFREASAYATEALADPKVRRRYEKRAAKANMRLRDLAISDYMNGKNLLKKK